MMTVPPAPGFKITSPPMPACRIASRIKKKSRNLLDVSWKVHRFTPNFAISPTSNVRSPPGSAETLTFG